MKTYKGMLNVVCCWCLCLSFCSFSLAEHATTEKPVVEQPELTQKITPAEKIALQKQKDKEIYDAKMQNKLNMKLSAADELLNSGSGLEPKSIEILDEEAMKASATKRAVPDKDME